MKLVDDFEKLYSLKKNNNPNEFKLFIDKWGETLSLDDIPSILRLYFDGADNPIQNEYVSQMLDKVFVRMPHEADQIIGSNYRPILHKEKAWDCIPMVISALDKTQNPQEYLERLYRIKKLNRPDEFAWYDGKWLDKFTVDDIPSLMKLYYSDADTPAQNEYITSTIDGIIKKSPEKGIEKIIENYDILIQEDSEDGIFFIICLLVWWNKEYIPITARILKKANKNLQEKFISKITESINKTNNLKTKEKDELFLSLYNGNEYYKH